jgi:hypothetical protein
MEVIIAQGIKNKILILNIFDEHNSSRIELSAHFP